ncbi:hypothetical protein IWW38_006282, partial [Coemansia aciculifera]
LLTQGALGPLGTDGDPSPEPDPDPDTDPERGSLPTTFVDLLSSDTRFSEFLHTVQRLRMVIPLNRVRNATFLVPTNEAISKFRRDHGQDGSHAAGSIYRGVADSQAWYHLIGDGIIDASNLTQGSMVWETFSSADYAAEQGSDGIMLKTLVASGGKVLANGVPVIAHNFSCVAGNVFQIDGLLTIPPTLRELLRAEAPRSGSKRQRWDRPHVDDFWHTHAASAGEDNGGTTDGGEYSAVEKLLVAAGWSHILNGPEASNETLGMHTLWAFSNQAFSSALGLAERAYLLYGSAFTKDEDADMHLEA